MKKFFFLVFALFLTACTTNVQPVAVEDKGIVVSVPLAGSTVSFPLTVKGEAKGSWYFEATFPVKLLDENGNILAETYAQAQSDWMQEGYVPFEAKFGSMDMNVERGVLKLMKDNPSGLPSNDLSFEVPVSF